MFPPASTSRLVVANVAELGKQEKREEMRLEAPCAKSSWGYSEMKTETKPWGITLEGCLLNEVGVLSWSHTWLASIV